MIIGPRRRFFVYLVRLNISERVSLQYKNINYIQCSFSDNLEYFIYKYIVAISYKKDYFIYFTSRKIIVHLFWFRKLFTM
jgi:hypothetical protein